MAEFPSWALVHYSANRSRVDLLFIDFLRHELGRKGSDRNLFLKEESLVVDMFVESTAEKDYFVTECLSRFEGRDKMILSYYFIESYSFAEIAGLVNISKSRVKQILDSLIKSMRDRAEISVR